MDWAAAARFLGALIDLIMLQKQLDILEMTKDRAFELADKQVALAEQITALHELLLAKVQDYYAIANNAPIYQQQYNCQMSLANIDVVREANLAMNSSLDATDMYSSGLRRDFIETAMGELVYSSSGQWSLAYRNEDDFNDLTDLRKYKHMVDSMSASSLFTGYKTMGRLATNTVNLARTTSGLINVHIGGLATGLLDYISGPKDKVNDASIKAKVEADRKRRLGPLATQVNTRNPIGTPTPSSKTSSSRRKAVQLPEATDDLTAVTTYKYKY